MAAAGGPLTALPCCRTQVVKPKTKKGKRALEQRAPKLVGGAAGAGGLVGHHWLLQLWRALWGTNWPPALNAGGGLQARADPVWQQDQPDHQGGAHRHPQAQGGACISSWIAGGWRPVTYLGKAALVCCASQCISFPSTCLSLPCPVSQVDAVKFTRKNDEVKPFEAGGETALEHHGSKGNCR